MNSLSFDDICSQLFYLSKGAINTIVLNSKCGIQYNTRSSKKSSPTNDISILGDFSPLLCIYKKASPVLIHSRSGTELDESSFKKEVLPSACALMTLCILELSDYYQNYSNMHRAEVSLKSQYLFLSEKQLDFYCENLRDADGMFVRKKITDGTDSKNIDLIEDDKKISLSDQAFMMNSYYLFYLYNKDNTKSDEYKNFSLEILDMFYNYKDSIYAQSFDECTKLLLSFVIFYKHSQDEKSKSLIIDLSDFLINKFDDKDYFSSDIESCSLLALLLKESYEITQILSFKEASNKIYDKLVNLYDESKGIFIKNSDKKDIKYSANEICLYFLSIYSNFKENNMPKYKSMISNLYKKLFINSGLIASWPATPTIDEAERYKMLSLRSEDMLDESFFRSSSVPTPDSVGIAPIINKYVTYSRKKDYFYHAKDSFESERNMFIFFAFIYFLKDSVVDLMKFNDTPAEIIPEDTAHD